MDNSHQTLESKIASEAEHYEHVPVAQQAFNRRHSVPENTLQPSRRGSVADSIKKSFDATNVAMVWPVGNHLEMSDDMSESNSIDDIGAGWFVWLVAATASIAGSLFGYDTGTFSIAQNPESLLMLLRYYFRGPCVSRYKSGQPRN